MGFMLLRCRDWGNIFSYKMQITFFGQFYLRLCSCVIVTAAVSSDVEGISAITASGHALSPFTINTHWGWRWVQQQRLRHWCRERRSCVCSTKSKAPEKLCLRLKTTSNWEWKDSTEILRFLRRLQKSGHENTSASIAEPEQSSMWNRWAISSHEWKRQLNVQ